ncbi:MAG TPA: DUF1778 domain-containing protein [Streptosporangiaceae bacterium]|nr:DUF1778 domain-containing protein [Streptosporangiaceae bacterium]
MATPEQADWPPAPPATRRRLSAAAAASHQTVSEFVLAAAEARADEVLATRTLVPADFFDRMMAEADEPAEALPWLSEAMEHPQFKQV